MDCLASLVHGCDHGMEGRVLLDVLSSVLFGVLFGVLLSVLLGGLLFRFGVTLFFRLEIIRVLNMKRLDFL